MSLHHRLSAKLDAALHQFEKLDLGYTYDELYLTACGLTACGMGSSDKKTQYPSLYVNRTKGDVMDIPETGKAVVEYVLTGRNMSKRDGKTTYGMDLQIKSFDPQGTKKADAKMKKDGLAVAMSAHARLTEFLGGTLSNVPLPSAAIRKINPRRLKTSQRLPVVMKKTGFDDEIRVSFRKKAVADPKRREASAYYTNDTKDARKTAADMARRARKGQAFSEFSDRTRNGDGQFVGNVTGGADPVTMRQAYGEKPKRSLLAPGVGAAALAGAGLLGTKSGRVMTSKAAKGASRMVRSTVAGIDRKIGGKTGAMWPRMGSKSKPKVREGLGEVIIRSAKSKTGPRMPRFGD